MAENPFTPSFGTIPLVIAGYEGFLSEMRAALEQDGRDPMLSTLVAGFRGSGKTALLACVREKAWDSGWVALGTVAMPGMLEDIYEQAILACSYLVNPPADLQLNPAESPGNTVGEAVYDSERNDSSDGASAPSAGNIGRDNIGNWRTRMTRLLQQLDEMGIGLLLTVDEANADLDEVVELAEIYQLFVSEGRKVALVMAGLPFQIHKLVSHRTAPFLCRARQFELRPIDDSDMSQALRRTFERSGKKIEADALNLCVNLIGGFPYMMQLVGYRTWNECQHSDTVTMKHARRGIAQALKEMDEGMLAATYRELSPGDVRYLQAMLDDPRESRTSDIAKRMGKTTGYAAKYKARLLARGIIGEPGRGWVRFDLPGFRYYLESRLEEEEAHRAR